MGYERRWSRLAKADNARRNRLLVTRDLAGSFDQWRERAQRLRNRKERVLQKLRRIWPLVSVNLERLGEVIAERWRQVLRIGNRWCAVRGDQIKRLQRILIEVRRFTLDHLCETGSSSVTTKATIARAHTNSHDTERPYIYFRAILLTCNNLRRHPIRRTDHSRSLRMRGIRDLCAEAEIS